MSKQKESFEKSLGKNSRNIQILQKENQSLKDKLNDTKLKMEERVHSLKEKLVNNEKLIEKLKKNLKIALEREHATLGEMREMLNKKDSHVLELQKEINRLQKIVKENKIGKLMGE